MSERFVGNRGFIKCLCKGPNGEVIAAKVRFPSPYPYQILLSGIF